METVKKIPLVESCKMNRRRHMKTIPLLIAFLAFFPILSIAGQYKVVRVVDGDTIVISDYQPVKTETAIRAVSAYIRFWKDELDKAIEHGEQLALAL